MKDSINMVHDHFLTYTYMLFTDGNPLIDIICNEIFSADRTYQYGINP